MGGRPGCGATAGGSEARRHATTYVDCLVTGAQADLRTLMIVSAAPVAAPKAKTQIFAAQLTEEERQKQYFDNLFQQKQAEVDSDEDDERLRRRNAPPEDDDW